MTAMHFLSRGLVHILSLCLLFCTVAQSMGQISPENAKGKEGKTMKAMIEQLGNHNLPPKLVDGPEGPLPLFPKNYDWKEQARVRSAIGKVRKEMTPEMWEELVHCIDDQRYCLTIKDQNEWCSAGHWSVGNFCSMWGNDWLTGVCFRHLPNDPLRDGYRLRVKVGLESGLKKWREQRADKQFYELQIEICELTIRELTKAPGISKIEKDRAREKIKVEIASLRTTKRAIFTDFNESPTVTYSPTEAEKARKELERRENK